MVVDWDELGSPNPLCTSLIGVLMFQVTKSLIIFSIVVPDEVPYPPIFLVTGEG